MANLSEKELSAINELLNAEDLHVKKFQMLASQTNDEKMKSEFNRISNQHQGHFNQLYSLLK